MGYFNQQEVGKPIAIYDEGVELDPSVESIDFVGAGVAATNVGVDITATIGGVAGSYAYNESIAGTGVTFTLAHAPNPTGSLILIKNGQLLTVTEDYTVSGTTLTLVTAKAADDILIAKQYAYA